MNSVIKGTGYILAHTPDMVVQNGTTQTTERIVNPQSDYLKALPEHLRSYEDALAYWPNQVYIGNAHPDAGVYSEVVHGLRPRQGMEARLMKPHRIPLFRPLLALVIAIPAIPAAAFVPGPGGASGGRPPSAMPPERRTMYSTRENRIHGTASSFMCSQVD